MPTMTAMHMSAYGPASVLQPTSVPVPTPQAGEVLVRVHAAGVNPLDWKIRAGFMQAVIPVPLPYVPGLELAGTVAQVGPEVTAFQPGQAVYGFTLGGGAYAEYAVVPAAMLAPKPGSLSFVAAATVPVGVTTAWQALMEHGALQPGQRVLILGGAGGVGSVAVQLAHTAGATVIATASADNGDFVRTLGADIVIDYAQPAPLAGIDAVDLVFDTVGGAAAADALATLKRGGTLLAIASPPDVAAAAAAGVQATFVSMVPSGALLRQVEPQLEAGQLRPAVAAVFALTAVAAAHAHSEARHGRGRIVLQVVADDVVDR